ncbi:MAG: anaerobic benzoate catabolism transcriptional regulator [Gemmataceae bacterium]|nr:anaerobic benzoate catabolism transcriptional regulator [Gemmataceae bacterium]
MLKTLPERFGELVRQLRLAAAMSQEDLAHAAGLHATYISRLERGKRAPSIVVVEQLAKALKTTMGAMLGALDEAPAEDG